MNQETLNENTDSVDMPDICESTADKVLKLSESNTEKLENTNERLKNDMPDRTESMSEIQCTGPSIIKSDSEKDKSEEKPKNDNPLLEKDNMELNGVATNLDSSASNILSKDTANSSTANKLNLNGKMLEPGTCALVQAVDSSNNTNCSLPGTDSSASISVAFEQNSLQGTVDALTVTHDLVPDTNSSKEDLNLLQGTSRLEEDAVGLEGAQCSMQGANSVTTPEQTGLEGACSSNSPSQSIYHVKWIKFKGEQVGIITQNENGPCPLLAIMNILLLQGKVKLPNMVEIVSSDQLMEYLGDCIFENAPKNITEESRLNYEQNMSDAMAVFHKLQTGLDVNVKFTGVSDFEYTRECIVFDLLNIRLYHGWLVDPQEAQEAPAVGNCSYNQLVEKIITQKNSSVESQVTEALVGEEFLNRTSHQLTYHGLCMLSSQVKDSQLAVFFRNNHFSTLLKHRDELLVLVTDQGFLNESNVVWETLSNVEGDCHFLDAEFRTYRKPEASSTPVTPSDLMNTPEQVDQDYLVALSLQQETQEQSPPCVLTQNVGLSDHELALKLQEEEDRELAALQRQQQAQQRRQQQAQRNQQVLAEQYQQAQQEERKKSDSCAIL